MLRKRVLLLVDFSRQGYAAHYAVLGMHASECLHVVLLVVGRRAGSPDAESAERFAELMAEAHVARGAAAQVVVADEDTASAVRREQMSATFDLVVAGDTLAACRSEDEAPAWMLVDAAGRVSQWPATQGVHKTRASSQRVHDLEIGGARWRRPRVALEIG